MKLTIVDNMPPALSWLQYLSFYNYAFEAICVNELADLMLTDQKFGLPIKVCDACIDC